MKKVLLILALVAALAALGALGTVNKGWKWGSTKKADSAEVTTGWTWDGSDLGNGS